MKKKNAPTGIIRSTDMVKVKKIKDEIEIRSLATCNKTPFMNVRRLSGGKHVNLKTGEIIVNKTTTHRGQSAISLRLSRNELRDILKANTTYPQLILLLTLTYEEKQYSAQKVQTDFKAFIKRLRTSYYTQFGKMEYVCVRELHEDMSFHIHAVLFFNESKDAVFIPGAEIADLWKHGNIKIGQPHFKEQIWHYLTPHIAHEVTAENKHMHEKAMRQMKLPTGFNLYSCSKGIKRPEKSVDTYENIKLRLAESDCKFEGETIYKNPLQAHNGNNLYYVKEHYKQEVPKRRKRI